MKIQRRGMVTVSTCGKDRPELEYHEGGEEKRCEHAARSWLAGGREAPGIPGQYTHGPSVRSPLGHEIGEIIIDDRSTCVVTVYRGMLQQGKRTSSSTSPIT